MIDPATEARIRELLLAGNLIIGPAIVHQYDSTTMIEAGWRGEVDRYGNLALGRT